MNISKYFWDLNENALRETERILKDPQHPKFIMRLVTFLSRCDKPKEMFSLISKKKFIDVWPKAKSYWFKIERESVFRDWWKTIYEQILQENRMRGKKPEGRPSASFKGIGRAIRQVRVKKGLSQSELAFKAGMKQPDISMIEEGKKNITLKTLISLCKALEIKKLEIKA